MRFRILYVVLLCLLAFGALPASAAPKGELPPFGGLPAQIRLDVQPDANPDDGLLYLSPIERPSQSFTHLMVRREAEIPAGATLTVAVRTSANSQTWTEWRPIAINDDLWMDSDGPNMRWSETVAVGDVAQFWQVRVTATPAPDKAMPSLRQVIVDTVDTRLSPAQETAQQNALRQAQQTHTTNAQKPYVISRTAWGSPDGQGSRAAPAYYPVNHLIIHHTADANTLTGREQSWADRVRAEWTFHTVSRGWGDIGYNYLIDPDGVIYEGRAGGDDAVGFHDTANYGSMGISVIGTYSSVTPTEDSQASLVRLLAWKAEQKRIDPQASSYYYGCSRSSYCAPKVGSAIIPNIAGHRQVTPGHTTCPGDAFMGLMPSIRQRVRDTINGDETPTPTPPSATTSARLANVQFDRTTVPSGGLVKVSFTIVNDGQTTLQTQEPQASLAADGTAYNDGTSSNDDAYVYDEGECYLGDGSDSYASFPKENGRFRVVLGPTDTSNIMCNGETSGYVWRWGLNGELSSGATRSVVGYIRFRNYGTTNRQVTLRGGLVQEYVKYYSENIGQQMITVTPEQDQPRTAELSAGMLPQASVYTLGSIPANFLARTANPLSIPRGEYKGSFAWTGALIDWQASGPFGSTGPTDAFVIEQTRAFSVPSSGEYTFCTSSDDGSWLWVDGKLVVKNHGLHSADMPSTGTASLSAGVHTVSFKYFERSGNAAAGYGTCQPESSDITVLPDATAGGVFALGNTFVQTPDITITADDQGGTGVTKIRYSLNGSTWLETPDGMLRLGRMQNGNYNLNYQAVDALGNASETRSISFSVDNGRPVYRLLAPLASR